VTVLIKELLLFPPSAYNVDRIESNHPLPSLPSLSLPVLKVFLQRGRFVIGGDYLHMQVPVDAE
jgi:hypothetical protein